MVGMAGSVVAVVGCQHAVTVCVVLGACVVFFKLSILLLRLGVAARILLFGRLGAIL